MAPMDSAARPMSRKVSILFVCMGNICRSPILMAILKKMVKDRNLSNRIRVDSCALTTYYLDQPIDPRMAKAAEGRNLLFDHRSRLIAEDDFSTFDLILAVDHEVLQLLQELASGKNYRGNIALVTAYSKRFKDSEMPDPYYGGPDGFEKTVEVAEDACKGIIDSLIA